MLLPRGNGGAYTLRSRHLISATSSSRPPHHLGHSSRLSPRPINPGPHQGIISRDMRLLINLRNAALAFVMYLLLSTGAVAVDDTIVIMVSVVKYYPQWPRKFNYKFTVGGSVIDVNAI